MLAKSAQRSAAIQLLRKHMESAPGDTEARVLLGTVLSWEGRYDEAREQLETVLASRPNHGDAVRALLNVELWSGHPKRAEEIAGEALRSSASNPDLLLARAKALAAQDRFRPAREDLDHVLVIDPNNEQALRMRDILKEGPHPWRLGAGYSYDWFSDRRSNWTEEELSLKRETPIGSVIGRVTRANHFDESGTQVGVEAYPRIRPGTYAYVSGAFSPHNPAETRVFPDYLFATEIYQSLGRGFEASVGYRRLWFADPVNIYVASLGKYYGSWLFTGRVYALPTSVSNSRSYHVSARRYFGDGSEYFGVRYARGRFREELRTTSDFEVLSFDALAGEFYLRLSPRWELSLQASYGREETIAGSDLRHASAGGVLFYRF